MSRPRAVQYAPPTRAVIDLVDPAYRDRTNDSIPESDAVRETLRANKYSRELLEGSPFEAVGADEDRDRRAARDRRLSEVSEVLNDAGVSYASMKNLRGPKVMMSDVDYLVPDDTDIGRAVRVLTELDFEFYQFRLLAHPLKVMAKASPADTSPVDIYPDAIWIRKLVCDARRVVSRAESGGLREPAPEDDLYLVATHSFAHLNVRFADVFHGVRVLEAADTFDWRYLVDVARDFGCADALVVYLVLLDIHLNRTGRRRIPESVLDSLSKGVVPGIARRWVSELSSPLSYPVVVPVWLANVASSLYHTPRVARQTSLHAAYKDFQSHYLSAASKLLTGET